jgi:RimJ/RimL family protein N-acetyltransferase
VLFRSDTIEKTLEANARAIRAYEKCGFRKEGVMRKARFKNGRYENDVLMSILQEEWRDL